MTSPVSLSDVIRQSFLYQLNNLHVAMPASIISYDYTVQKAQVQPLLNKVWADGTITPYPVLSDVPVIFPRAGGASFTFPVVIGDTCLLLFVERSTDLWKTTGGQVNPDDPRKFDLSDGVAIMGLSPFSQASLSENNTDVLLTYEGSKIRIKENGDIVLQTASTVAIGNETTEVLDVISRVLNILITSLTTTPGNAIQQLPIPPNGDTYTTLQTLIDNLKGSIP